MVASRHPDADDDMQRAEVAWHELRTLMLYWLAKRRSYLRAHGLFAEADRLVLVECETRMLGDEEGTDDVRRYGGR